MCVQPHIILKMTNVRYKLLLKMCETLKILVVGDTHFKVSNIRDVSVMSDAIIKVIHECKPDIIVNLGDTLNDHEKVHVIALVKATEFLYKQAQLAPLKLLMGNHDLKNQKQFCSQEHPFTSLKYWGPSLTLVDDVMSEYIKGHHIVYSPYVPPERFEEAMTKCADLASATCVFGHVEILGCQMGAIKSVNGAKWPLTSPLLISGHIHDYQELQPNVIYTGTPIQHSYNDTHDKTISLFTFRSQTDYTHNRIDLELPKKRIERIECAQVSSYVPRPNCDLKIIIRGTVGDLRAITKHPNVLAWKALGHKVTFRDIPLEYINNIDVMQRAINKAPARFSEVFYLALPERLKQTYLKVYGSVRTSNLLT